MEEMMHAKLEISWDSEKSKWLARITSGEEVIRRYFDAPKNADENTLQSAAKQTATDEGYEADAITIRR